MTVEIDDKIKEMYDHSEGKKELTKLIKYYKTKVGGEGKSGKKLLDQTNLES